MKRCDRFVHEQPNKELQFTESGLEKFRCFDACNWRLAGYVQYVDDQLAAELRQGTNFMSPWLSSVLLMAVGANKHYNLAEDTWKHYERI